MLTQSVGNSTSLNVYKQKNHAAANWLPDVRISGRQVGYMTQGDGSCLTYVQSRNAGIITTSSSIGLRKLSTQAQCEEVLKFTTATVSKMPE